LRSRGTEDARCVLPTSATQSNYVYPHLARSRLASASFDAWTPHGVEAPRGTTGGPGASRRPRTLRWIGIERVTSNVSPRGFPIERGRFLPTALAATEPLTPLSPLPRLVVLGFRFVRLLSGDRAFASVLLVRYVLLDARTSPRVGEPPRSRSSPLREERRLTMIRDAFHRPETLPRIRWPLQPRFRDPCTLFRGRRNRWMTLSRHPGSVPVLARIYPVSPTYRPSFRPERRPTLADDRSELGPRSLASDRPFGGRVRRAYSGPEDR
jgi:hypothetical protein